MLRQAQLLQGTDHSVAGDTAQFACFDRQANGGEGRSDHGHWNIDAGTNITGTTDDLNGLMSTHIYAADAQLVGIGVFVALQDMADHHALGPGAEIINVIHLKACHRQTLGEIVHRFIHLDQLLQPGDGYPHRI